jgi:hypothetical protein
LDLDLLFEHSPGGYRVRVLRSPAGDGQSVGFARPFTDLELENFVLKVGQFRGRARRIEAAPVTQDSELQNICSGQRSAPQATNLKITPIGGSSCACHPPADHAPRPLGGTQTYQTAAGGP